MTRRVLDLLTALSLVLCVGAAGAWARSMFVSDSFTYTSGRATMYAVKWARGRLELARLTSDPAAFRETADSVAFEKPAPGFAYTRDEPGSADAWGFQPPERDVRLLGVRYRAGPVLFMYARHVSLPLWMVVVGAAAAPSAWYARRRRRQLRLLERRCPA